MGLLPAEHLLEPPAGATRDPPKAVPAVPPKTIAAAGEIVTGMRIGGEAQGVTEDEILVENEGFEFVPTALRLGFPLMVKKLHDAQDSTGETLDYKLRIYIYELMKTPGLGLPITWNANGNETLLPPLHLVRSDGLPFGQQDWKCLTEFKHYLEENYVEPERVWHHTPADFKKWVRIFVNGQCLDKTLSQPEAFADIDPCLDRRFPLGMRVTAVGTSKEELNGLSGLVTKYDPAKGRVGVEFAPPFGLLSLKATNISIGAEERSKRILDEVEKQNKKNSPSLRGE